MNFLRTVRFAEIYKDEAPLKLPPNRSRHYDGGDRSTAIMKHLDIVDAAVRQAKLILDPELLLAANQVSVHPPSSQIRIGATLLMERIGSGFSLRINAL